MPRKKAKHTPARKATKKPVAKKSVSLTVFARCVREVMEANPGMSRAMAMRFCSEAFAKGKVPKRFREEKKPVSRSPEPKKALKPEPKRKPKRESEPKAKLKRKPKRPAPLAPRAPKKPEVGAPPIWVEPPPEKPPEKPKEVPIEVQKPEEEPGLTGLEEDVPFPVEGQLVYRRGHGFVMV